MKKVFIINEDYKNTRLDRWYKRNIFQVPQSFIEKNIRKGNIKVNNKKVKSSYKVQEKDEVSIISFKFDPNKNKRNLLAILWAA